MDHGHGDCPPPPAPCPPAHVVEAATISRGGATDGSVIVQPALPTNRRGNPAEPAGAAPSGEGPAGSCDLCGATGTPLVSWRAHLQMPHAVVLRGICVTCSLAGRDAS